VSYLVDECHDLSAEEEKGGGKRTIPTVRNLQRKSRIVRVFLGSSMIYHFLVGGPLLLAWGGSPILQISNQLLFFTKTSKFYSAIS
jgi:hypothetical protein